MKIVIETIPHDKQRYPTVGDFGINEDGSWWILVSETGSKISNLLVAAHEFIEFILTQEKGIAEEEITKFDVEFEKNREEGNVDEPGFDSAAPYRNEHAIATGVELMMAAHLGYSWSEHEKIINEL